MLSSTHPLETSDKVINNETIYGNQTKESLVNEISHSTIPDMKTCLKDIHDSVFKFFENDFTAASQICQKYEAVSFYHSYGKAALDAVFALLTLEQPELRSCRRQLDLSIALCQKSRRQQSMYQTVSSLFVKPNYEDYTDEEAHAELCYSELNLLYSLVTVVLNHNIMALIKAASAVRTCNNAYKVCSLVLKHKCNWKSPLSQQEFEAGVSMGLGIMNITLSYLPPKLLAVLAMVGFSGDRRLGFDLVHNVTDNLKDVFHYKITICSIPAFGCYIEQTFGTGEGVDVDRIQKVNNKFLKTFPTGAFPLFYSARIHQIKGNPDEAIEQFQKCLEVQKDWKQIHNVCYWDLCWCYAIKCDWDNAAKYAKILRDNCHWSPATNMYQYACFLYMKMEEENKPELRGQVDEAMRNVPQLKIRYAGKTIPPEKFAVTKANAYLSGKHDMVLSALELFYVWNIFGNAAGSALLLDPLMDRIETVLKKYEVEEEDENYYLALFLKGVCSRYLGKLTDATECFTSVIGSNKLDANNYLLPHSALELGLTQIDSGHYPEAKPWLDKAKDGYKGFLLESMLQLRVSVALKKIRKFLRDQNAN